MVVARHPDGRVVLMAQEHGLKPMLRGADGIWRDAKISGEELREFLKVRSEAERQRILRDGLRKAGPAFMIGPAKKVSEQKPRAKKAARAAEAQRGTDRKQSAQGAKAETIENFDSLVARIRKGARARAVAGKNLFTGELAVKGAYSKTATKRPSKVPS